MIMNLKHIIINSEHIKNSNKKSKIRRQRNKELQNLERFISIPHDSGDIKL